MLVRIHHGGRVYVIEAPANARVVQTSGEDCLVYQWSGRTEYLLTPQPLLVGLLCRHCTFPEVG